MPAAIVTWNTYRDPAFGIFWVDSVQLRFGHLTYKLKGRFYIEQCLFNSAHYFSELVGRKLPDVLPETSASHH